MREQSSIRRRRLVKNGLTYALGARCSDGVVIVADKRITETSGEVRYGNKTFPLFHQSVITASTPSRGHFELFLEKLRVGVKKLPPIVKGWVNYGETKIKICELIQENYSEEYCFETLLGIRATPLKIADLFHFNDVGIPRKINDYYAIGRGEPLGRFLLQRVKNDINTMTMRQVAVLGVFIILYIEKLRLDDSVGIGEYSPTIWWIPDLIEPYTDDRDLPSELIPRYNVREERDQNILNQIKSEAEDMFQSWCSCTEQFFDNLKALSCQSI